MTSLHFSARIPLQRCRTDSGQLLACVFQPARPQEDANALREEVLRHRPEAANFAQKPDVLSIRTFHADTPGVAALDRGAMLNYRLGGPVAHIPAVVENTGSELFLLTDEDAAKAQPPVLPRLTGHEFRLREQAHASICKKRIEKPVPEPEVEAFMARNQKTRQ